MSPSNGSNSGGGGGAANGRNYIEHQVSKMDTLAGVAIKYGVEVSIFSPEIWCGFASLCHDLVIIFVKERNRMYSRSGSCEMDVEIVLFHLFVVFLLIGFWSLCQWMLKLCFFAFVANGEILEMNRFPTSKD